MKFSCSVDIDLPLEKVVTLFKDPENLQHWQDGFVKMEHISGVAGTVGAKTKLVYKQGKRDMILTETIEVMNFPDEMTGFYHHEHMDNRMQNLFTKLGENKTRWTANLEYLAMRGFMPKLFAKLFPGMFRKQTQKWLDQFKKFAEAQA